MYTNGREARKVQQCLAQWCSYTRACAWVKFECARVKIMPKAKVKDQQLFTRARCSTQLPITRTLLGRGLRANNSVMRSKRSDNESTMKLREPFLVAKITHENLPT